MKKYVLFIVYQLINLSIITLSLQKGYAQSVGINSTGAVPDVSAMLDVNHPNKGLLVPRVALTATNVAAPVTTPATSLLVYNTATTADVTPGYYYWSGTAWQRLATGSSGGGTAWLLTGNAGTDGTNFIGTTDNVPFNVRVNNQKAGRVDNISGNTFWGYQAGLNTIGGGNTANGINALFSNTTGGGNTALGSFADVSSGALDNATAIGTNAIVNASNKIRLGNTLVTVIEGQVAYSFPSDARFKYNIKNNVPGLDFIKKLTPVTYYFDEKKLDAYTKTGIIYNSIAQHASYNGEKQLHTGFLAQDVEKIANELGYSFDGVHAPANEKDHYSLAYSQFIMPLVKAVQEQQQQIDALKKENEKIISIEKENNEMKAAIQELSKTIKAIINK